MSENEPQNDVELEAEIGHIIHEVTGGEGDLVDKPVPPPRGPYQFIQRVVNPDDPIEPSNEQQQAAPGPPPPLPPPEDMPDQP
ncbi:MAG TPA: hypothetical protein VHW91_04695 [Candidatus Dormibacteraeota bacterium]|jgi:hypothetical protein|nr:hypothetical protein [Candidatus Dormibacteraeota bacterium]